MRTHARTNARTHTHTHTHTHTRLVRATNDAPHCIPTSWARSPACTTPTRIHTQRVGLHIHAHTEVVASGAGRRCGHFPHAQHLFRAAARPPMRVSTGLHTTLLVGVLLRRLGHSDGHWPHGLEFGFHAPDRRSRAQSERSASCTDRTTARSRRLPPALAAAGPRGVKWCGPAPVTTCTASHGTCRPVPPPPPRIPLPRASSSWAPWNSSMAATNTNKLSFIHGSACRPGVNVCGACAQAPRVTVPPGRPAG